MLAFQLTLELGQMYSDQNFFKTDRKKNVEIELPCMLRAFGWRQFDIRKFMLMTLYIE